MEENLLDYILFFAIENNIKCNNNYCFDLTTLHNYRKEIVELIKNDLDKVLKNKPKEVKDRLNDFIKSNLSLTKEEELNQLKNIQSQKSDYFIIYKNKIYINNNMPYEDFVEKRYAIEDQVERDTISIVFKYACKFEAYKKLGTTNIMNDVKKIIDIEKTIEETYNNPEIDTQNIINIGKYYVGSKLFLLTKQPFHVFNEYYETLNEYARRDNYNSRITDIVLSEETRANDKLFLANAYIDDELSSIFQKSIFDEDRLCYCSLLNIYDYLWEYMYKDEMDYIENDEYLDELNNEDMLEEGEYDSTEYDRKVINLWFYMNYINQIEEYQKMTNSNELEPIKNRLLYALSSIDSYLLDNKHYKKIYDKYSKINFSKDDYIEIPVMTKILLNDLLRGNVDDLILKKVIFISNYYNLTRDKSILHIFNKAKKKNNIYFNSLYDAIINNNYSNFTKKGIQKIKDKLKE